MNEAREKLIDAAIQQILLDAADGDYHPIAELLRPVSDRQLKNYVPELSGEDESTEGETA